MDVGSDSVRPIYNLWLRLAAILFVFVAAVMWAGQAFLVTNNDPDMPWNEEFRISKAGAGSRVQIGRVLRYRADVDEQGDARGQVNLLIYPDGVVKGVWNGEYTEDGEVHRLVMAACFEGNVDASKAYVGFVAGQSEGESAVYFITKGTYVMLETEVSTGVSHSATGFLYVRGWLYPDYTAIGELVTTADKRTCQIFEWGTRPSN